MRIMTSVLEERERQEKRWTDWAPHNPDRIELERQTLFMPQHLLAATDLETGDNHPTNIAVQIEGYVAYHQNRGTLTELLVFTRSDFLVEILREYLALDHPGSEPVLPPPGQPKPRISWGRTPEIRAEERAILIHACLRAYEVAKDHTERLSGLEPLPEVAEIVRKAVVARG